MSRYQLLNVKLITVNVIFMMSYKNIINDMLKMFKCHVRIPPFYVKNVQCHVKKDFFLKP